MMNSRDFKEWEFPTLAEAQSRPRESLRTRRCLSRPLPEEPNFPLLNQVEEQAHAEAEAEAEAHAEAEDHAEAVAEAHAGAAVEAVAVAEAEAHAGAVAEETCTSTSSSSTSNDTSSSDWNRTDMPVLPDGYLDFLDD